MCVLPPPLGTDYGYDLKSYVRTKKGKRKREEEIEKQIDKQIQLNMLIIYT